MDTLPRPVKPRAKKLLESARQQAKKALDRSSATRDFLRNLFYRTSLNGLSKFVMFLLTLWLTRVLTPEEFSIFVFVISISTFLTIPGSMGVPGALLRIVPSFIASDKKKQVSKWVLGGIKVVLINTLLITFFLLLFWQDVAFEILGKPELSNVGFFIISLFVILNLANIIDSLTIALKRNEIALKSGVLREVIKIGATIILVLWGWSYIGAISAYILSFFVFFMAELLFLYSSRLSYVFKGSSESITKVLSYAQWFVTLSVLVAIMNNTDIFMISIFLPLEYVGYYKIAVSIVGSVMFLLPIVKIAFPTLSESGDARILNRRFKKLIVFGGALSLVVAIVLCLVSPFLLFVLYPERYASQVLLPLFVLAFVIPVRTIFWLNLQRFIILGREKLQLKITLLAAVMNVILNCVLIPIYGTIGAAVSTLLSLFVVTLLGFVLSRNTLGL